VRSKDTAPERAKRFLETAREVGASEDPKDFDEAFKKVVSPKGLNNPADRDRKS
jgi:hypothetical protein